MLNDQYKIRSTINKGRGNLKKQNIRNFLTFFNAFYDKLRMREKPNFYPEMRDPYGFALLCEDYKNDSLKYDMDMTCEQIFNGEAEEDRLDLITYQGQFTFKEILDMLYIGFIFDYRKAVNIYENQHNAFHVFNQIINGDGYIHNRARPNLKNTRRFLKYAFESSVNLDENSTIHIPHIWRLCDGMPAPFIIMKYSPGIRVEKANCHGFGEGIFLISNNKIIDCLKINDTWFVDLPLESRLKFAYKCTDYEVEEYIKVWSFRSALEAGRILGADSSDGLLVRCARDGFFDTRWFNWSKTSLVYCKKRRGELVSKAVGGYRPEFYTLEGDEGLISPLEERKYERVYLDDWDIREFQKILGLGQ